VLSDLENVGTVDDDGRFVNVGYRRVRGNDNNNNDGNSDKVEIVTSEPGLIEGVRLLSFRTNAPVDVVASFRGIGMLLALIEADDHDLNLRFPPSGTLDEALARLKRTPSTTNHAEAFRKALRLWARHARDVWPRHPQLSSSSSRWNDEGFRKA